MDDASIKPQPARWLIPAAWTLAIASSLLPVILWDNLVGTDTGWVSWVQLIVLGLLILLSVFVRPLKPLRHISIVLLIINFASAALSQINFISLPVQRFLGGGDLVARLQPDQLGKLGITLFMFVALALMGYNRKQMYLVKGDFSAPITPVKWLGFPKPEPWWKFGLQYGFYIPIGVAVVMLLIARPTGTDFLDKVVPVIPAILLFAALNALYEEFVYRASMLATLETHTGIQHAWWISAVFFGIGHFYGVPYGWLGIVLATFTGWLWGKAMVETRGFAWAWWMHFLMDVTIFTFMAMGAVTPGG